MFKRGRIILFLLLLLVAGGWFSRFYWINLLQLSYIKSISNKANLSNQLFKATAIYPNHKIYTLKGVERFFPHRVNSLRRLKFLYDDFKGFECDIHFDSERNSFFVTHGDVQTDSPTLLQYLEFDKQKKIFWLDVKNLSDSNVDAFCNALLALDKKFGIRDRVIVESADREMAELVAGKGFFTSFYLPLNYVNGTDQNLLAEHCNDSSSHISTVSEDIFFHKSLQLNCPQKRQLTWDISFLHSIDKKILLQNVNDSTILVCLLNIKSPGNK